MWEHIKKHVSWNLPEYLLSIFSIGILCIIIAEVKEENILAPCIIKNQQLSQPREVCVAMRREGLLK